MTVKETILGKFEMKEGVLTPIRTAEQLKEAKKSRTILDQEYNGTAVGDYKTIKVSDLNTSAVATNPDAGDKIDTSTIHHTDILKVAGVEHNVVALKSTTEVLETIPDGKYQALSIEVEFDKSDAECLEGQIKPFQAAAIKIPKSRKALNVRDGFIIIEPSINGFHISILAEDLDDQSYDEIMKIAEAIDKMHAHYLCRTVKALAACGVPVKELIVSQAAVGVIPRARRRYERMVAEQESTDGNIVITNDIKDKSRQFADKLNEELKLMPLTRSSFSFGISVYTIEVSTDPARKANWTSARRNFSYFNKGNSQGRIERLINNYRTIPLMTEDIPEVITGCESIVNAALPILENAVRKQLGVEPLKERYKIPDYKPEANNIIDLFNFDPVEAHRIATAVATKANKMLNAEAKNDQAKSMSTVLGSILSRIQKDNSSEGESES